MILAKHPNVKFSDLLQLLVPLRGQFTNLLDFRPLIILFSQPQNLHFLLKHYGKKDLTVINICFSVSVNGSYIIGNFAFNRAPVSASIPLPTLPLASTQQLSVWELLASRCHQFGRDVIALAVFGQLTELGMKITVLCSKGKKII